MNSRKMRAIVAALFATLALGSVFAATASAAPAWKFNSTSLTGKEAIVGAAEDSYMTVPGLTTDCENFLYSMTIENSGGTGKGSVTELPLFDCGTNSVNCTVEAIEAKNLPWPTKLMNVSSKPYLFIENIYVTVLYGGKTCALGGVLVPIKGTAGGAIDNTTESATFNAASFTATGAALKTGATSIQWVGYFPTEGFEWHRGESISVG